ncbi:MAG: hypothetical protein U5K71_00780 [Gracilimonas sp.]|nr:hypothetical protein [Gracilimonas sp.]
MLRFAATLITILIFTVSSAFTQLYNDPDIFETDNGDLKIHPVLHGSVIFE